MFHSVYFQITIIIDYKLKKKKKQSRFRSKIVGKVGIVFSYTIQELVQFLCIVQKPTKSILFLHSLQVIEELKCGEIMGYLYFQLIAEEFGEVLYLGSEQQKILHLFFMFHVHQLFQQQK